MKQNQSHFADAANASGVTISTVRADLKNKVAQAYGKTLETMPGDDHTSAIFNAATVYAKQLIADEFGGYYNNADRDDVSLTSKEVQRVQTRASNFIKNSAFSDVFGRYVAAEMPAEAPVERDEATADVCAFVPPIISGQR